LHYIKVSTEKPFRERDKYLGMEMELTDGTESVVDGVDPGTALLIEGDRIEAGSLIIGIEEGG